LSGAPREQWPRKSKLPATYTHADLARIAYEVDTLTPAQLSAVRRATARLVEQGTVLRDVERAAWTQTGREPYLRTSPYGERYADTTLRSSSSRGR
jgi:hypothetical protein